MLLSEGGTVLTINEIKSTLQGRPDCQVSDTDTASQIMVEVPGTALETVRLYVNHRSTAVAVYGWICSVNELDPGLVQDFLLERFGPVGLLLAGEEQGIANVVYGEPSTGDIVANVYAIAGMIDSVFGRFGANATVCNNCGADKQEGSRFCGNCGAAYEAHSAHDDAPSTPADPNVFGPGTYIVGREIQPGLYRYQGYFARRDAHDGIIANGNTRSGLGLFKVDRNDELVEISGEAIAVEFMPSVDPIASKYREGEYIVGVDIAPGRYRISESSGIAFAFVQDRNLATVRSESNRGSSIVNLTSSDFSLRFSGFIERI